MGPQVSPPPSPGSSCPRNRERSRRQSVSVAVAGRRCAQKTQRRDDAANVCAAFWKSASRRSFPSFSPSSSADRSRLFGCRAHGRPKESAASHSRFRISFSDALRQHSTWPFTPLARSAHAHLCASERYYARTAHKRKEKLGKKKKFRPRKTGRMARIDERPRATRTRKAKSRKSATIDDERVIVFLLTTFLENANEGLA